MKMPDTIDSKLFAPCGVNCISCERYQNPCVGCLIGDDGRGSAAYVYPYTASGRRGECFDPWANDQDFALYYILRAEDETDLSLKGKR